MTRVLLLVGSLYLAGWSLMIGVGIVNSVWGVGTVGFSDSVRIVGCLFLIGVCFALAYGLLLSFNKD